MTETSTSNLFANLGSSSTAPEDETSTIDPVVVTVDADANETDEDGPAAPINELEMLKNRARIMGIKFSNAIKVETLRAKIQEKLNADGESQESDEDETEEVAESDEIEEVEQLPIDPEKTVVGAPVPSTGSNLLAQLAVMSAEEKAAILHLLGGTAIAYDPASVPSAPAVPKIANKQAMREEIVAREMALVRCRITNMDPKKANLPGEIFTVANEYLGTVKKFVPYGEVTEDGYHLPRCLYNNLVDRTFVLIKSVKNKNGRGTTQTTTDAREFAIDVLPPLTANELARLATAQAASAGN